MDHHSQRGSATAAEVRERLRRAGLLAEDMPVEGPPPNPAELARARAEFSTGTPLSETVIADRD